MGLVLATTIECLLLSPVNYIRNINFFSYSFFLNIVILCFFSYRYLWWSKNVLYIVRVFSCYFLVFVCHFLVYLSELFWSKFVRAAIFIMFLPFCFAALNLSINQSIYLPAIYLPICLYEVICSSFLKAVLSAETIPFIKTIYREIQIQTKALQELYWAV